MQLTILESIFNQFEFNVVLARNGFEAFEEVVKSLREDRHPFNLIILDLNMPIADGFEAIKNIKNLYNDANKLFKLEGTSGVSKSDSFSNSSDHSIKNSSVDLDKTLEPVIIACTSFIDDEIRSKIERAGFDALYMVPLQQSTIENEIIPMIYQKDFAQRQYKISYKHLDRNQPILYSGMTSHQAITADRALHR